MKTNRIVLKAIAAAVLASTAGLAAAGGTTNVDVTATVPGVCTFSAATMPLSLWAQWIRPPWARQASPHQRHHLRLHPGLTPVVTTRLAPSR